MHSAPAPVVFKFGGSLLSLPDLPRRLRRAVAHAARPLLVVGGGPTADLVREWDRRFQLGEERAHRLALQALVLNEALLHELLPESRIAHSRSEAEAAWTAGRLPILCAQDFLAAEERHAADPLPRSWDVTSDSVAAWVARCWPAGRLVLLKSVPRPHPWNARQLTPPLVDPYFHRLAPSLPEVEWVNLRDDCGTVV